MMNRRQMKTKLRRHTKTPTTKTEPSSHFDRIENLLRELKPMPQAAIDIQKRNEILRQNKLYNLDMERRRLTGAIMSLAPAQAQEMKRYLTSVENDILGLKTMRERA